MSSLPIIDITTATDGVGGTNLASLACGNAVRQAQHAWEQREVLAAAGVDHAQFTNGEVLLLTRHESGLPKDFLQVLADKVLFLRPQGHRLVALQWTNAGTRVLCTLQRTPNVPASFLAGLQALPAMDAATEAVLLAARTSPYVAAMEAAAALGKAELARLEALVMVASSAKQYIQLAKIAAGRLDALEQRPQTGTAYAVGGLRSFVAELQQAALALLARTQARQAEEKKEEEQAKQAAAAGATEAVAQGQQEAREGGAVAADTDVTGAEGVPAPAVTAVDEEGYAATGAALEDSILQQRRTAVAAAASDLMKALDGLEKAAVGDAVAAGDGLPADTTTAQALVTMANDMLRRARLGRLRDAPCCVMRPLAQRVEALRRALAARNGGCTTDCVRSDGCTGGCVRSDGCTGCDGAPAAAAAGHKRPRVVPPAPAATTPKPQEQEQAQEQARPQSPTRPRPPSMRTLLEQAEAALEAIRRAVPRRAAEGVPEDVLLHKLRRQAHGFGNWGALAGSLERYRRERAPVVATPPPAPAPAPVETVELFGAMPMPWHGPSPPHRPMPWRRPPGMAMPWPGMSMPRPGPRNTAWRRPLSHIALHVEPRLFGAADTEDGEM